MAKRKKRSEGIAQVYADLRKRFSGKDLSAEEARAAAAELRKFGLEADGFIDGKLESAPLDELKMLLQIVAYLEDFQLAGLSAVLQQRNVPLELKKDCFELLTELGRPIEAEFLGKLQEADEIYTQLGSLLAGDAESKLRCKDLADDFLSLPSTLQQALLQSLRSRRGIKALPFLVHLAGIDSVIDPLLVEAVGKDGSGVSIELLKKISAGGRDKEAVKQAKRALYRLREKGVNTGDTDSADASAVKSAAALFPEEKEQAFTSNIETYGSRLAVLAVPSLGELLVCHCELDDHSGLKRFSAAEMPRKSFREYLKDVKGAVEEFQDSRLVEIEPDHARWLLEEAYKLTVETGGLIPEQYKSLRYRLKAPEGYDPSALLRRLVKISDDDVRSVSAKIQDVFAVPEVSLWIVEREAIKPFARRFIEMAESKLVLSNEQKQKRLEDSVGEFAADYFSGRRLKAMVRRLEETAILLAKLGRSEEAKLIAATAKDVESSSFLKPHAFLTALLGSSLYASIRAVTEEDEARHRSGAELIIRPNRS